MVHSVPPEHEGKNRTSRDRNQEEREEKEGSEDSHACRRWKCGGRTLVAVRRGVKNTDFLVWRAECAIFLTGPHCRPYADDTRRYSMAKTSKKAKSPAKSAKRKVAIKDLKAKNAGLVKGGGASVSGEFDISKRH